MHAPVETRRPAIAEVCRRFGVRRLDVFGSATAGGFDPQRSDVDVLVQFGSVEAADPMGEYFGLKTQLESVLGRPVDLLVDGAVRNPYVLAGIAATRQLVYAA
jgi:predicted nucleotidyltransferase